MSTHQDYMDARMLHAFLDGELDGTREEVLFEKLSSNGALRAEMQQHLAMRQAIQQDTEAFTPPAAATSAIFASLGFSLPPQTAEAMTGSGSAAGAAGTSLRRLGVSTGSAVLALVAAIVLYLQFPLPESDAPVPAERVVSVPPTSISIQETPALGDIPVAASRSGVPAAAVARPADRVSSTVELTRVTRDLSLRPVKLIAENSSIRDLETSRVRAGDVQFFDLLPMPDGVTVYARNVSLRSDPAPTVVSQSEPWFKNTNIGLMYALSEHHSIGIEGGREAFSQHFGNNEDGAYERGGFEQNPLAYWATAVYQFNGDALLPLVHPFGQAQFGAAFSKSVTGGLSALGPLARAVVGVKFKPYERIAIIVGVEGNVLLYRFDNTWYNTNKIGMTYGVGYEF